MTKIEEDYCRAEIAHAAQVVREKVARAIAHDVQNLREVQDTPNTPEKAAFLQSCMEGMLHLLAMEGIKID